MVFENRRLHYGYRHSPLDSLMSRAVLQASRRHTGRAPKFDSSMIQRLFILNARAGSASAARAADAVPALLCPCLTSAPRCCWQVDYSHSQGS